jgi:four helix bundle protein
MKIKRFEEIKAWQEARILVQIVFQLIKGNRILQREYRFKEQLTSSAISVMSNIAEGFSRKSDKEFAQFLFIAKGSIAELQSHLYVALDQDYITKDKFTQIYDHADKVAKLLSNFITYLLETK